MKNERSRFEKRTQSFQKTNAVVFQKQRLAAETKGRRRRNEKAPAEKMEGAHRKKMRRNACISK